MRCSLLVHLVVPPGGCFRSPRRIELGPRPLTIGRLESCDVRIDVPGVDGEHAKISEIALIAIAPDCAIGDVPLDQGARRLVAPGDEVQIGSVVIVIEGDDPSQLMGDDLGRRRPEGPRVRVVEGANFGDELVMHEQGKEYVVGRHPEADLVLEDREVSREHIKLLRKGYSIFIKDLTSTRGSWLGRAAVYQGATVEWTRPRMLRVGASVLSLELPDEIRKAAAAPAPSAPMTPPPPHLHSAPRLPEEPLATPAPVSYPTVSCPAAPQSSPVLVQEMNPNAPVFGGAAGLATPPPFFGGPAIAPSDGSIPPKKRRTAWKKEGATMSRGSGLLLLGLAAIVVLGAIFGVFSLLE